jgi:hypothetical protein
MLPAVNSGAPQAKRPGSRVVSGPGRDKMEDIDMSNSNVHSTTTPVEQSPTVMTLDDHLDAAAWFVEALKSGIDDLVEALANLGGGVPEDVKEAADDIVWEAERACTQIGCKFDTLRMIADTDDRD